MRTRALLLASAASAAAIIGGWQLGDAATESPTMATGSASAGSTGAGDTSGTSSTDATSSGAATSTGAADGTYTGRSVPTRFGDVQVRVTISGGSITDVTALRLTDSDGRSVQISNRAAPMLRTEVLQAQSASVSMIGGATYTSAAYLQSLQSALDAARF
ncbi:FMN-binding protein [Agromyces binzhouensis]|uniref:FMN-binding protein n=1 Tax=Agromyces binzhouensis TaxID=1817495 RepID=A0A4Q2JH00_9MICO|nr:FMN-binding protein [Agromyces binzhouensis]RXZ45719.1 FMN-binding protein [Agromyces binzhouensis]